MSLLSNEYPEEENIADFYKFAATYAFELGDAPQAMALLKTALERNASSSLQRELRGLLQDILGASNPVARAEDARVNQPDS